LLLSKPSKHEHVPATVLHRPRLLHTAASFVPGTVSATAMLYVPVILGVTTSGGRLPLFCLNVTVVVAPAAVHIAPAGDMDTVTPSIVVRACATSNEPQHHATSGVEHD
jgi:hypothetical protein